MMKRYLSVKNSLLVLASILLFGTACRNRSAGNAATPDEPAVVQDTTPKAIHHGSENQATLDSIKAAKEKGK